MRQIARVVLVLSAVSCASQADVRGPADDAARFEEVKSLAGTWVSYGQSDAPPGSKVTYRVTAAGSAVEEVVFAGSPHEMVTLYTLDRGRLVLTHYCALANQPRMELQPGGAPHTLTFDCTSLGNGNVSKDMHMHHAEFRLVDASHIESAWTMWKDGAADETVKFMLERTAN